MIRFSHIIGILLVGVITLTAQSAALARTMPDASGQMVICTGTGPMLVHYNEDGEPIDAPQLCPECALSVLQAIVVEHNCDAPFGAWSAHKANAFLIDTVRLQMGTPNARGPPVSV